MSEEAGIETNDLRESVSELQDELEEERKERKADEKNTAWTRWIALSTAILAVVAAIGALQSGSLVNEAMIQQLRAADTWNQYQATREKEDLFTVSANALLDRGITLPAGGTSAPAPPASDLKPVSADRRLADYLAEVRKEQQKEPVLRKAAEADEHAADASLELHHRFAWCVALIQVAIALAAIAALTKMRWVWGVSLTIGAIGLILFAIGWIPAH